MVFSIYSYVFCFFIATTILDGAFGAWWWWSADGCFGCSFSCVFAALWRKVYKAKIYLRNFWKDADWWLMKPKWDFGKYFIKNVIRSIMNFFFYNLLIRINRFLQVKSTSLSNSEDAQRYSKTFDKEQEKCRRKTKRKNKSDDPSSHIQPTVVDSFHA